MPLGKLHELPADTLPLMTRRHGDDADLSHLILHMDTKTNKAHLPLTDKRQPDVLRFSLEQLRDVRLLSRLPAFQIEGIVHKAWNIQLRLRKDWCPCINCQVDDHGLVLH